MRKTLHRAVLFTYLGFMFGRATELVGTTSTPTTYTRGMPFGILLFIAVPALLGYLIGKDDQ